MSLNYFSSQDCYLLQMRQNTLFQSHELTHAPVKYKQKNESGRKKPGILFNEVVEIAGAGLEDIIRLYPVVRYKIRTIIIMQKQ